MRYNIKDLHSRYIQFLIDNNLTILNKQFTRYAPHQQPSTLDHIITNVPQMIGDIRTERNIISDHCSLSFNFLHKNMVFKPRFKLIRNFKNITSDSLKFKVAKNINIQNVLRESDADIVATTLQTELNQIIDDLALQGRIQVTRTNQPYLDNSLRDRMTEVGNLLTTAIQSKDREDWRLHNNVQTDCTKTLTWQRKTI